jgi:hypothetical protein
MRKWEKRRWEGERVRRWEGGGEFGSGKKRR